ncbi:HEAT repeat domain-containing protein [Oculatella sp. FACHB-28]|uniref:HEAT repeat domain-containing protein n=1 Tax=Oculatella sp. FACHB-28 TaxID=2692845 RepID=UPI001683355E|nr:HEAT repeat domain-containing protein [Oculatella sp. FACHB-28]MBD2057700.1 HEAT repeat domain-containing protein [Oculatella sp. FACHB-28]
MFVTKAVDASELIRAVEQADSPSRLVAAVNTLATSGLEAGIPTLIAVLGYNNPEAASVAVEGLIRLGDVAVLPLIEQLDEYNYGARAYSFRALAAIADPRALEVLLSTAETDFAPSVRRAAAKGLGNLRWEKLPEGDRAIAQDRTLQALLTISHDPDWAIRYAAIVGLQALAIASSNPSQSSQSQLSSAILERILERLTAMADDPDLAVQARAWMAQQQLEHLTAP